MASQANGSTVQSNVLALKRALVVYVVFMEDLCDVFGGGGGGCRDGDDGGGSGGIKDICIVVIGRSFH